MSGRAKHASDDPTRRFRHIQPRKKPIRAGRKVKRKPRRAGRIKPRDRQIPRKACGHQRCPAFHRKPKALAEKALSHGDFCNRQTVNANS